MKHWLFLVCLVLIVCFPTYSQERVYKKAALDKEDIRAGVKMKYEYSTSDGLIGRRLSLYKNQDYLLEQGGDAGYWYSKGKWVQKSGHIEIFSNIDTDNIPVKLTYKTATDTVLYKLRIELPQNIKGEELNNVFFNINSDTVICDPLIQKCKGSYASLDSVRLVWGDNWFVSKWIKIEPKVFSTILPVVQLDFSLDNYMFFKPKKFRIHKSTLIEIE